MRTSVPRAAELRAALEEIHAACLPLKGQGEPAGYIPELSRVDPHQFGMCLTTVEGEVFEVGDSRVPFSVQSISKVLLLSLVLPHMPEVFRRVSVEPSGDPFNSLVQLEYENGIPRNPFINAGALVLTDILMGLVPDAKKAMLAHVARLLGEDLQIGFDGAVAQSELRTASRNRSLAYLMKSFGNLHNDVEAMLDVYCHHCALSMDLSQLTRCFAFLANAGVVPSSRECVLTPVETRRVNALMLTCGFYDESGEFAFRVGLPGKSGVGGGILTVLPGGFTLATWSPGLNAKGNSLVGMRALELFASRTGLSPF